jgi:hypothetical protein
MRQGQLRALDGETSGWRSAAITGAHSAIFDLPSFHRERAPVNLYSEPGKRA